MENMDSLLQSLSWLKERLIVALATYFGWMQIGILGDRKAVTTTILFLHIGAFAIVGFWSVSGAIVFGMVCLLTECMLCGWLGYLFDTS